MDVRMTEATYNNLVTSLDSRNRTIVLLHKALLGGVEDLEDAKVQIQLLTDRANDFEAELNQEDEAEDELLACNEKLSDTLDMEISRHEVTKIRLIKTSKHLVNMRNIVLETADSMDRAGVSPLSDLMRIAAECTYDV